MLRPRLFLAPWDECHKNLNAQEGCSSELDLEWRKEAKLAPDDALVCLSSVFNWLKVLLLFVSPPLRGTTCVPDKADRQTDHSDLQQTWPPLHRSAAGSGHPSRSGSPPKSCQSSLPGVKTPPSQSASPSKSNLKFNNLPAATQQICHDFLHFRVSALVMSTN